MADLGSVHSGLVAASRRITAGFKIGSRMYCGHSAWQHDCLGGLYLKPDRHKVSTQSRMAAGSSRPLQVSDLIKWSALLRQVRLVFLVRSTASGRVPDSVGFVASVGSR